MIRLDLVDLVVIAGRALALEPDAVLADADLEAAAEVLEEAERCHVVQRSAAVLLHGLATRRPFGPRSAEVALLAALQLLALNRLRVDELGQPESARKLLDRAAAGAAGVDELTAWLFDLLPGPGSMPAGGGRRARRPRESGREKGGGKMFERFTDRARRMVVLAQEEARVLNHNHIGTEHLLLGLIREGEGVAAQVLTGLGADLERVRQQVIQVLSGHVGVQEGVGRTRMVRMTLPADFREAQEQVAQVRRDKEAAIDAQDFDRAATLRDREKELLAWLIKREQEWAAGVDLDAVVQENRDLHGEVERLRDLLRRHGIEPDGGTAETA